MYVAPFDTSAIELGKLYDTLKPEWMHFLKCHFQNYDVPTEVVVTKARTVEPVKARVYRVRLYLRHGRAMDFHEMRQDGNPRFRGTVYEREVVMVEVWDDKGDDGHVKYYHLGWRFVPHDTLVWVGNYNTGIPHPLPEAMRVQFWDIDTLYGLHTKK